jgi:hypothetical protein
MKTLDTLAVCHATAWGCCAKPCDISIKCTVAYDKKVSLPLVVYRPVEFGVSVSVQPIESIVSKRPVKSVVPKQLSVPLLCSDGPTMIVRKWTFPTVNQSDQYDLALFPWTKVRKWTFQMV